MYPPDEQYQARREPLTSELSSGMQRSPGFELRSELAERDPINSHPSRLITKAELRRLVPYTPQHIRRLEKRGLFPRRIQVGPNRVAWLLSEIEAWIAARAAERDVAARLAGSQKR